jgi:hypothetical protein
MSQSIIIESINFDGEFATILLTPYNNDSVVNIGLQQLPYTFNPSLINPLLEIYGTYTLVINENGKDCVYFLNVIKETPTPTPTPTPTKTPTQTPTITPTVTPTYNPCLQPSQTPTPTQTKTPTQTPTTTPTTTPTIDPCKVTRTPTPTNTLTPGLTQTPTPTETPTPTVTPTITETPTNTPTNTVTPTPTRTPPIPCDFEGELLKECDFTYEFLGFPPSEFSFENLISGDYIDGTLETNIGVSSVKMSYVGGGLVFDCTTSGLTFAGLGTEVPQFQNYLECGFNLPLSSFAYKVISPIEMTFTFTPAVTNPLLFFWSLGQSGNCQTFSSDTSFQNFNYCYNVSGQTLTLDLANKTITGCEGFGTIEFTGTFNQIKLSVLNTECRTNFLWGNIIYGVPD